MSEYQRYEFMTIDRPLTAVQLDAVDSLSSHIEATSTHAIIEYHWGDFKHDPIQVLHEFFDGYDFEDFVTFTRYPGYDILDIQFGEMEAPDEWTEYELGSLIPIRDELMEGDLRSLYIVWLAAQRMMEGYDEEEDYDEEEEDGDEEKDYEISVPPGFGTLTAGQYSLAELLQVPQELLVAAARHSKGAAPSTKDDFTAAWVKLLPPDRQSDYLVRLAYNEPGLSRLLVRELRELGQDKTTATPPTGERVPYVILLPESKTIRAQLEREKREQEQAARLRPQLRRPAFVKRLQVH